MTADWDVSWLLIIPPPSGHPRCLTQTLIVPPWVPHDSGMVIQACDWFPSSKYCCKVWSVLTTVFVWNNVSLAWVLILEYFEFGIFCIYISFLVKVFMNVISILMSENRDKFYLPWQKSVLQSQTEPYGWSNTDPSQSGNKPLGIGVHRIDGWLKNYSLGCTMLKTSCSINVKK